MVGKTRTIMLHGISGFEISIECDVSEGMPTFQMVGYLGSEVREAKERVMACLKNSGYKLPSKKVTINLTPAGMHKSGTGFDLPIAIALLIAYGMIWSDYIDEILFIGELSLTGEIRPVRGILPMMLYAKSLGIKHCVVPAQNLQEADFVEGMNTYGIHKLSDLVSLLTCPKLEQFHKNYLKILNMQNELKKNQELIFNPIINKEELEEFDFAKIKGQEALKRGCEVAACGMHNLLMIGPPGTGKSMIAKSIGTILPELTRQEQIEVASVYSVYGLGNGEVHLSAQRPFRSPHHKATIKGLLGGGNPVRPGEVSLANHGILFLDELAEFATPTIEALRQPIEERKVHVVRCNGNYTFPANFSLVAAMNPCPCGFYPDLSKCHCTHSMIKRYLGKVSGPMLDRFDLCIQVPQVEYEELRNSKESEHSSDIRKRVTRVHEIQRERFEEEGILFNSQMTTELVEKYCSLTEELDRYMQKMFHNYQLSARSFHRILKVARTIADMREGSEIERRDLDEALMYRSMDWKQLGGIV